MEAPLKRQLVYFNIILKQCDSVCRDPAIGPDTKKIFSGGAAWCDWRLIFSFCKNLQYFATKQNKMWGKKLRPPD